MSGSTPDFQAPPLPPEVIDIGGSASCQPLLPPGFDSHTVLKLPTVFGGAEGEAGAL